MFKDGVDTRGRLSRVSIVYGSKLKDKKYSFQRKDTGEIIRLRNGFLSGSAEAVKSLSLQRGAEETKD